MNVQKDINLTGGKLIGEGSNTCIFKPNLPCKDKKIDINKENISKLFLKKPKDLLREIKFNEKISQLPQSKEWSITLYNHCKAPDYETIKKVEPDLIFHLAAQPLIYDSYKKPYFTYEVNTLGTLNILESVKELNNNKIKALICITSDKCYADNFSTKGFKETD